MIATLILIVADEASQQQAPRTPTGTVVVVVLMAIISLALCILALRLILATKPLKNKVEEQYKNNADIIRKFERALSLLNSEDEDLILVGLQDLWALPDPRLYPEVRPVLNRFSAHTNPDIASEAKQTLERFAKALVHAPAAPTRSGETA